MAKPAKSETPRWILIGTGVLGLVAALLVVVTRVYEIQKARAEATRARAEAKQRELEIREREATPPTPPSKSTPPTVQPDPKPAQPATEPPRPNTPPGTPVRPPPEQPDPPVAPAPKEVVHTGPRRAEVVTSHGRFVIELDLEIAPKTCTEFVRAIRAKEFDDKPISWRTIGNRRVYDGPSGSDQPMAAGLVLGPFRWLDDPPGRQAAQRLAVCVDNRYGDDKAQLTIRMFGPGPGTYQFARVIDGRDDVERIADGWWQTKGGKQEPRLRLMSEKVVVKSLRVLP